MSGIIRSLWPEDIKSDEVLSPEEILQIQADELSHRTGGVLSAHVIRTVSDGRVELLFEVEAVRLDRRMQLFTVRHREEFEYPAAIIAPDLALPSYLQKHCYQPGIGDAYRATLAVNEAFKQPGKWVENEGVATSPTEFTTKLQDVLANPAVKASVLSLIARSNAAANAHSDNES